MKLKPTIKGLKHLKNLIAEEPKKEEPPKQPRKRKENKLPSDAYKPMFEPIRFLVRETHSSKSSKVIKHYMELSVKRFGDDDENQPTVYLQMYQESDFYTGYLKGKNVNLPLEMLYDLMDYLSELSETCDKLKIE